MVTSRDATSPEGLGAEPDDLPDDLRDDLARAWPELATASIARLAGGLLHTTYAVDTRDRRGILQRVNPVFSPLIHGNIDRVTRHLASRGMRTFELWPTREGLLSLDLAERGRYRVMDRLPGETFDTCDSPARARAAGSLIGRFHSALADFPGELASLGFAYHDTPQHLRALSAALTAHPRHPRAGEIDRVARELFAADAALEPTHGLPLRVLHGDLKFSNVLFEAADGAGERASSLIDLDTLSRLPLYFDMGDAWRSWCNPKGEDEPAAELDLGLFRASAEGYLEHLDFVPSAGELRSLVTALERLCLELAARFATDALEESYFAWDPDRFESRSAHNLVRARGQLSLLRHARETRDERSRALAV